LSDGSQALDFLKKSGVNPFIILCDMDMPRMDGRELWQRINQDPQLRKKGIPFIFLTSHDDLQDIAEAYDTQTVQGFFVKGNDQRQIREILRLILSYWDLCLHPNTKKFKYS
jgi:CheY-like chemotaxis protein